MERYLLDKTFEIGKIYRAERDKGYIIRKVGTDNTANTEILVAGGVVAELAAGMQQLCKKTSNMLGPLELGDLYIVVPPDKILEFSAPAGGSFHLIGEIVELGIGERLPAKLVGRYDAQLGDFKSFVDGAATSGENEVWGAGVELDAVNFSAPAGERWVFDSICTAKEEGNAWGETWRRCAIRFYVNDRPFDIIEEVMGERGVEAMSMGYPPKDKYGLTPFTLESMPIELKPGDNLRVTVKNVSGGNWAAGGAGVYNRVTIKVLGERIYV